MENKKNITEELKSITPDELKNIVGGAGKNILDPANYVCPYCGEKCPADVKDPISWYFNHLYYVHGVMPIGG